MDARRRRGGQLDGADRVVAIAAQKDRTALLVDDLPAPRHSRRLAVVTETYPPEVNGVANTAARFVEGLRARNHEIQLVRPRQNRSDHAGEGEGVREVLMRGLPIPRYPTLKMGLPAKQALTAMWARHRPDIVHIVTEGPLGWSALQAAHKLKIPVSSDFRTNTSRCTDNYCEHKWLTAKSGSIYE